MEKHNSYPTEFSPIDLDELDALIGSFSSGEMTDEGLEKLRKYERIIEDYCKVYKNGYTNAVLDTTGKLSDEVMPENLYNGILIALYESEVENE